MKKIMVKPAQLAQASFAKDGCDPPPVGGSAPESFALGELALPAPSFAPRTQDDELLLQEENVSNKKENEKKFLSSLLKENESDDDKENDEKIEKTKEEWIEEFKKELNDEQHKILKACFEEPRRNIFITGEAGTGKTHLINQIEKCSNKIKNRIHVTASTGFAAVNIGGGTFHSYVGIGIGTENKDKTLPKRKINFEEISKHVIEKIQRTDTIIIDEISMLTSDFKFDAHEVFQFAKNNELPFGGIQMIFVGDFLQLPEIQKGGGRRKHFFVQKIWKQLKIKSYSLKTNHRQKEDPKYASFLTKLRFGEVEPKEFHDFVKERNINNHKETLSLLKKESSVPCLFSRNEQVDQYNKEKLSELKGETKTYVAKGDVEMMQKYVAIEKVIVLKIGASVILRKNISIKKNLYNGKRGVVIAFGEKGPIVKFSDGLQMEIEETEWVIKFDLDDDDDGEKVIYTITQIPLMLGYGVTVHKTQGITLENIIINPGFFVSGHAYVAFSRVKNMNGVFITDSIPYDQVKTDEKSVEFYKKENLL